MKLCPAKCHERATLRKLWRQTGNSSLLPAKCWPLLHVIAGISARFSNFAFVLFCHITNHLMTGPLGNSEFCFPRISMFPSTSSRKTLRFSGNKIHCSPRDQSLSVYRRLSPRLGDNFLVFNIRLLNIPIHFFIFRTYKQTRCLYGVPCVYKCSLLLHHLQSVVW